MSTSGGLEHTRADYGDPRALRAVRRWAERVPADAQAYGHLRPPSPAPAPVGG